LTAALAEPSVGPEACDALFRLGAIHHREGRLVDAGRIYAAVLKIRPDHADSLHLLGLIAYQGGRFHDAVQLIAKALRLNSTRGDYASNLGNALQRSGKLDDAQTCYRAAIQLNPRGATAHNNLGAALRETGHPAESAESCRVALALRPDYTDAHNNLGTALADLGQFEAAAESYYEALRLDPGRAEARNNLGNVLSHLGRMDAAIEQYRLALDAHGEAAEVRHNLGMALLRAGRFEEGWREYEARWSTRQLAKVHRDFAQPQWDGSPLGERVLLVHAEQGFGDTLQFCRYVSRIPGRVVFEVQPALVGLMRQLAGAEVIANGAALPAFDVHCPMMSLPRLVCPTPDPADAQPYLVADPVRAAAWAERLTALPGLKVGLVWAGGSRPEQPTLEAVNRRRSMSLERLAPLATVEGVSFVSLQKGPPSQQAAAPPPGMALHDFTGELHDFADTAALVEGLDVVISVDTAMAHLAGALGKPVWLLNRFDSCWRWLGRGAVNPWYASLTDHRQPAPGDWDSVVETARLALVDCVGKLQRD
jgi:tetratricopeptide (TPR) repeat protein